MQIPPIIQSTAIPARISALADSIQDKAESFGKMLNADNPKEEANPTVKTEGITEVDDAEREKELQRVQKVGEDFEALFFSMMLKVMRESISSESDSGLFAGEGSDTYGGMFDTFIGKHMATTGQLGLADMVVQSLMNKSPENQGTGSQQGSDFNNTDSSQEVI